MHAIDPVIQFLTNFPANSISLKGEDHYSPLLSSVNLQTILLQTHGYGACDCGQVNHPARQSALGTQACRRVAVRPRAAAAALSTSTQLRFCPRAARAVPRAPRTLQPACRAARATLIAFTPSESAGHSAPAPFNLRPPMPCPTSSPQAANVCSLIWAQPLASKVSLPFRAYRRPVIADAPVQARSR